MEVFSESAGPHIAAPVLGADPDVASNKSSITVFLINRDKDRDRLKHMERAARVHGFAFERVKGVEGFDVPSSLKRQFFDESMNPLSNLLPGEVGCYASHLLCCQKLLERDLDFALVLEDDIDLDDGFMALIDRIVRSSTHDWDIIRLSSLSKGPVVQLKELSLDYHLVKYTSLPKLTGAQLWSREGAKKMLRFRERVRPVDADLRYGWEFNLITLGVCPPPATQGDRFPSSIYSGQINRRVLRGGRWKQITLRSRLRGFWRALMHLGFYGSVACGIQLASRILGNICRRDYIHKLNGRWRVTEIATRGEPAVHALDDARQPR